MASGKPGLLERAQQAEQRGNREVRDLWDRYRGHREHLTAQILALAAGGRLCLLGAGNGNDLDLEPLCGHFDEVHLVDLDPTALSRLTGRQTPATRMKLRSHAPVDLSGLYRQLDRRLPGADAVVAAGAAEVLAALPSGFDAVASCCVLSQMSWAIETLLPEGAPVPELQQALLRVHLRTLLGLVAPAGAALLAADMISSLHCDLEGATDLPALARQLAADRVAFPVCNPELIRQVLRRDPALAGATLGQGAPWLWEGPKELTYLVCPLVLRRGP